MIVSTATTRTPAQELATVLLGVDVVDYVAQKRADGARWVDVCKDLEQKTDGRVSVTDRAMRSWLSDRAAAERAAA